MLPGLVSLVCLLPSLACTGGTQLSARDADEDEVAQDLDADVLPGDGDGSCPPDPVVSGTACSGERFWCWGRWGCQACSDTAYLMLQEQCECNRGRWVCQFPRADCPGGPGDYCDPACTIRPGGCSADADADAEMDVDAGADSGEPPLRLTLTSEVAVPGEIDGLRLSVVASRTSAPLLCGPIVRTFPLAVPGDLPTVLEYRPGPTYDFWIGFRAEWIRAGTPVSAHEIILAFPTDGRVDAEIRLTRACYDVGVGGSPCGDAEQCLDGLCVGVAPPDPFDSPELVETAACDFLATGP
jgi:hypothetical protein